MRFLLDNASIERGGAEFLVHYELIFALIGVHTSRQVKIVWW